MSERHFQLIRSGTHRRVSGPGEQGSEAPSRPLPQDGASDLHGEAPTPRPRDMTAGSGSRTRAPLCEPGRAALASRGKRAKSSPQSRGCHQAGGEKREWLPQHLVSRKCPRNARYEHHLTYPSISSISLAFFVKNFRPAEMWGKRLEAWRYFAITVILRVSLSKTSKPDQRNMWRARWKTSGFKQKQGNIRV